MKVMRKSTHVHSSMSNSMRDKNVLVRRTDEFLAVIGGIGGRGSLSAKDSIMLL